MVTSDNVVDFAAVVVDGFKRLCWLEALIRLVVCRYLMLAENRVHVGRI